jgi:hypothetical protein
MAMLPAMVCPRCGGRMLEEDDIYGKTSTCIACGFVRDSNQSPVRPPVTGRESHPSHGKGKGRFSF